MAILKFPESEMEIQRSILDWLKARGILSWRCALGGIRKGNGAKARNPLKGFPDIAGVIERGRFFTIEVKTKSGRLSPEQKLWRDRLTERGVLYILAYSLDDVQSALLPVPLTLSEQQDAIESLPDIRAEDIPF